MIDVKIIELGSAIATYTLEDGATVADLFEAADKEFIQGNVTLNNQVVNSNTPLRDNDRVFVGKAMKGNLDPFEVEFVRLGDTKISLPAEDGYTIKRTLEQLSSSERQKFYRPDGNPAYELRVGGGIVDENYVIPRPVNSSSVRIICAQKVKGNKKSK